MQAQFNFTSIGVIHSCFRQKFGVPRQPGLAPAAKACVELIPPYNVSEALSDLQGISHIWLVFAFHLNRSPKWKPRVRAPRLGGNKSLAVFASRSPYRPNPIGLSVVELLAVEASRLWVSGVDIVDGTPILDIKPYVPYTDAITGASNPIAPQEPQKLSVVFSESALALCRAAPQPELQGLIVQVLSLDPRPQYHAMDNQRIYGISLFDKNIRWKFQSATQIIVLDIQ
ncbi:MAG: tRNA (N6-threonylcarbamoyladenosine(37)-N6)-methyltransferase TrmO [Cellvibrionaceae bacterium]|nr:tRNA (N6-threonylcarbamoyladenosine(37)-N6)-methyltransferase TrmO [Cellvibrionaceae bacterium]